MLLVKAENWKLREWYGVMLVPLEKWNLSIRNSNIIDKLSIVLKATIDGKSELNYLTVIVTLSHIQTPQ